MVNHPPGPSAQPTKRSRAALTLLGMVSGVLLTVGAVQLLVPLTLGWLGLLLPVLAPVAVAAAVRRVGPRARLVAIGMAGAAALLVAYGVLFAALYAATTPPSF